MGKLQQPRSPRPSGLVVVPLVVIAATLVGLLVVGVLSTFDPLASNQVDRSGPAVLEKIRELEQFTAAEGQFVQTVDFESDAKYLPSVLKGERVVASVQGNVQATVDFGSLDQDAVSVSDDRRSISLRLPAPELQSADIEEDSTRILTRDRGIIDRAADFFSENPSDDTPLYRAAERKVDAAAAASDLEQTARTNTERWLRTFLGAAGFDTVSISWAPAPR
ncbi:MAG: DUF4230 domain-containing protein [Actinomycetes bacterium]